MSRGECRGERRENEWISVNIFDSYSTYFMPGEVLIFGSVGCGKVYLFHSPLLHFLLLSLSLLLVFCAVLLSFYLLLSAFSFDELR